MMRPAPQILLLAMLLAMLLPPTGGPDVTPDPGEIEYALSEEENEWCFELTEGAKCGPGRRFVPDGGAPCALCEDGISYQPRPSRCPKCIMCSECESGYRVKTNCTIFANTVCEPDSQTTTKTPTPSATGNITNPTTPAIPMNLITTAETERAEHGSDDERNKVAIALGVPLGLMFISLVLALCYIRKLRKGYGEALREDPDIGEPNGNQQVQEITPAEPVPESNGYLPAETKL